MCKRPGSVLCFLEPLTFMTMLRHKATSSTKPPPHCLRRLLLVPSPGARSRPPPDSFQTRSQSISDKDHNQCSGLECVTIVCTTHTAHERHFGWSRPACFPAQHCAEVACGIAAARQCHLQTQCFGQEPITKHSSSRLCDKAPKYRQRLQHLRSLQSSAIDALRSDDEDMCCFLGTW